MGSLDFKDEVANICRENRIVVHEEMDTQMNMNNHAKKYEVFVDDNFHYMDENERYIKGVYDTAEEAISVMQSIVDEFIIPASKNNPEATAEELYDSYRAFGEDPWCSTVNFSARAYAKKQCDKLGKKNP